MIKVSAIAKEKLKAVGTLLDKTVAVISTSKISASASSISTALSITTGLFFNWIFRTFQDIGLLLDQYKLETSKNVSNIYYTEDKHTIVLTKPAESSGIISDGILISSNYFRNFQSSGDVSDSVVFYMGYGRLFQDFSNSTDSLNFKTTKLLEDQGYFFDNAVKASNYNRTFTSAASFTDDVNGTALDDDQNILFFKVLNNFSFTTDNSTYNYFKNLSNNAGIEDIFGIYNTKSTFNTFSVEDSASLAVTYSRNPDSISQAFDSLKFDSLKGLINFTDITDELQRSVAYARENTDGTAVSELFNKSINYNRTALENLNFTDTQTVSYLKTINDVVISADQVEYIKSLGISTTDGVSFTDDVNGAALDDDQNIFFFKINTEGLITEDLFDRTVSYSKQFNNTYSVEDLANLTFQKSLEDFSNIFTSHIIITSKVLSNNGVLSDTHSVGYLKQLSNNAFGLDSHSLNIYKQLSNTFNVSEEHFFNINYYRTFIDNTGISEFKNLAVTKGLLDTSNILDSISYTSVYNRNFVSTGTTEDFSKFLYYKLKENTATLFDSTTLQNTKSFNDAVSSTDDVNGLALDDDQNILFFKVLSNSSNIAESVQFFSVKQTENFSTVSDGFSLLNQNFIDPSYLAEDYVGESRTIT